MKADEIKEIRKIEAFIKKTIEAIKDKKLKGYIEQKIIGKRPSQYVIKCDFCGQVVELAFTGVNIKKKKFKCFDCMINP